jgi:hypothetical protein
MSVTMATPASISPRKLGRLSSLDFACAIAPCLPKVAHSEAYPNQDMPPVETWWLPPLRHNSRSLPLATPILDQKAGGACAASTFCVASQFAGVDDLAHSQKDAGATPRPGKFELAYINAPAGPSQPTDLID